MESVPDDELEPWERPGAVRRDCEPHRGELLARLADLAAILGVVSVFFCVPTFVALPLALTVVLLASRDLDRMAAVPVATVLSSEFRVLEGMKWGESFSAAATSTWTNCRGNEVQARAVRAIAEYSEESSCNLSRIATLSFS